MDNKTEHKFENDEIVKIVRCKHYTHEGFNVKNGSLVRIMCADGWLVTGMPAYIVRSLVTDEQLGTSWAESRFERI